NNLWTSWIELGEKFYEAIVASRMPIDLRALRALKNSSLALDTYTFLVYRTWGVNERGAPSSITWKQLEEQLGSNYGNTKSFKRYFKEALHKIKALYSSRLRVREVEGGIVISPGSQLIENRA
ncbi:MAG: plasmid encoded RepA protein, partial [Candidatus Latescibacteria bacterium]|nr:plasmid encoded RepA protein [Candidatus Latescibacterota bacterium]